MLVAYVNSSEIIVTTLEDEHEVIKEFFGPDNREIGNYERYASKDKELVFTTSINVSWLT